MTTKQYYEVISSPECLKTLYANDVDLEEFFYLYSRFKGLGLTRYLPAELDKKLYDKGYLTKSCSLSKAGLDFVSNLIVLIEDTSDKEKEQEWNKFWAEVPETDAVHHFPATRKINNDEEKCKAEFYRLRSEGYSASQIIDGMINHVNNLTTRSIRRSEITFMKSPLRWLKEKEFEVWAKAPINTSNTSTNETKRLGNVL